MITFFAIFFAVLSTVFSTIGVKSVMTFCFVLSKGTTILFFKVSLSLKLKTYLQNEYNNAVSLDWNAVEVTGIPAEGIITDTIYFEKTGGGNYGGLGELEITAQRLTQDYPISYYEAADGHKITTDEEAVQGIFAGKEEEYACKEN